MFVSVCFLFVRPERPAPIRNGGALPPSHLLHTTSQQISKKKLPKYERNLCHICLFQWSGEGRGWYPAAQHPSVALELQSGEESQASQQSEHRTEEAGDRRPQVS